MKCAMIKRFLPSWLLCCLLLAGCSSIEAATDDGNVSQAVDLYDASDAQAGEWTQAEILHEASLDKAHRLNTLEESSFGLSDEILVSPCDIGRDQIHAEMTVKGTIAFLDGTNPNGLFLSVEDAGCHMGLWVEKSIWHDWDPAAQDLLQFGQEVFLRGVLTSYPGELILEVNKPPLSP
jgi:hypothetical protein